MRVIRRDRAGPYFDVIPSVVVTALPEQSVSDNFVNVQLVQDGVRVLQRAVRMLFADKGNSTHLAQASGEDDDLVDLTHLLQKVVHSRALDDIDVVPLPFDFDRNDVVSLRDELTIKWFEGSIRHVLLRVGRVGFCFGRKKKLTLKLL